jgi:hypothetical protein
LRVRLEKGGAVLTFDFLFRDNENVSARENKQQDKADD